MLQVNLLSHLLECVVGYFFVRVCIHVHIFLCSARYFSQNKCLLCRSLFASLSNGLFLVLTFLLCLSANNILFDLLCPLIRLNDFSIAMTVFP